MSFKIIYKRGVIGLSVFVFILFCILLILVSKLWDQNSDFKFENQMLNETLKKTYNLSEASFKNSEIHTLQNSTGIYGGISFVGENLNNTIDSNGKVESKSEEKISKTMEFANSSEELISKKPDFEDDIDFTILATTNFNTTILDKNNELSTEAQSQSSSYEKTLQGNSEEETENTNSNETILDSLSPIQVIPEKNLIGRELYSKDYKNSSQNTSELVLNSTEVVTTEEQTQNIPESTITVFAYNNFVYPFATFKNIRDCFTLPVEWHNRIASANTHGTCIEICQYKNCLGRCIRLEPGSPGHNRLRDINFDKRLTSVRSCKRE